MLIPRGFSCAAPTRLRHRTLGVATAAALFVAPGVSVGAQGAPPARGPARGPLITGRDLATLGVSAAAAGLLVPLDVRIARWSQQPEHQGGAAVRATAAALRTLGDPGVFTIGVATFGTGALLDRRGTAAVGLHSAAAIAAGSVVTGVIKSAVGRARPYMVRDSTATDVRFARGLRRGNAYQSLPSGHATAAFAFAGALAAEGGHRWPATNRWTAPAGFAVAGLVAASRVYHDRHWASDVALGGGIGATAGAVLVRYVRAHPANALDRRLLPRPDRRSAPPTPLVSWTMRF